MGAVRGIHIIVTPHPVMTGPVMRGVILRFGEDTPPPAPGANQTTWWEQSVSFAKRFWHKVSSIQRFKTSLSQGYEESKHDIQKIWHSGSPWQITQRVGMEALGVVVFIACIPIPGPNPGWLVSPTARTFIKGFMKEEDQQPGPPPQSPG